jgi:D-lactate dehydrogenase (cytochrome)
MIEPFQPAHADYLRDESRRTGCADRIAFPRTETEVVATLAGARSQRMPITTQGARTGISGGAVPEGGLVLNLARMEQIAAPESGTLRVQPGVTLASIRAAVPAGFYFAPDPTEPSASIGGMISCNSSGALSYLHGPTRDHILGLRVATVSGEVLALRRGRDRAAGLRFQLGSLAGEFPPLPRPAVKNAAGYFIDRDMDLIDLFIGAEGTLGIVTEATLRLLPAPDALWGLLAFLPSTAAVVGYVDALRQALPLGGARLAALEYFDSRCLDFLRERTDLLVSKGISVPTLPDGAACVYAEWHAPSACEAETALMAAADLLPRFGADADVALLADNSRDIEKLKLFRHAVPELVNSSIDERRKIHPGLVKLGTDMSVPNARLADVLALYEGDLAASGLEHLTFGHIGANHLHVNILPRHPADYAAGRALYARWAAQVIAWGGSISAEHGIGKIKRDLFRQMAGAAALAQMRGLKKLFDPDWLLNPGTLLEAP